MPLISKTPDERWLEFVARTASIVGTHPYFWPIRQPFYKLQFEQQKRLSLAERLKNILRIGLDRESSQIPAGSCDVIFWLHGSREPEVEAILPLWRRVQAMGLRAVLVAPRLVIESLSLASSEVVVFAAPQRFGQPRKWRRAYHDLRAKFPEIHNTSAEPLLTTLGRYADSYQPAVERVLNSLRPKLLVLPVDQFMPGASACLAARQMGVRSLVLLHGAVSAYNAPLTADSMAVWGEVSADQMVNLGAPRERLKVLGSPRHDVLPSCDDPEAKRRLHRQLNCDDKPCLTFFSNGNDLFRNTKNAVVECARWLEQSARELKDSYNILVRLHPNEDGSLYTGCSGLRVFKNECDLGTTLAGSDVVAALCSTVLSEAVLYKKPVLQFHADGWPELADNWRRGFALRIESSDALTRQLATLKSPAVYAALVSRQQGFAGQVFASPGKATATVAQHIFQECAG